MTSRRIALRKVLEYEVWMVITFSLLQNFGSDYIFKYNFTTVVRHLNGGVMGKYRKRIPKKIGN